MAQIEYQKDRGGCRERTEEKCHDNCQVWTREKSEAHEDERNPEYQHRHERWGDRTARLSEKNARLRQIDRDLDSPGLHLTLSVILRCKLKQFIEELIGLGTSFKWFVGIRCSGIPSTPNSIDQRVDPAPQQNPDRLRLRAGPRQDVVE